MDVGTTFTAAAIERDGVVAAVPLGARAHAVPTVVLLGEDGRLLVGEEAARRAPLAPARVARHFKRTVGDRAPMRLAGRRLGAHELVAAVMAWVVDQVTAREGGRPPDEVVLTMPATWDGRRRGLVVGALDDLIRAAVVTVPEPVAAGHHHALRQGIADGEVVAVYDLGGGTCDAAVIRSTGGDLELVGLPVGDDRLGGLDVDQLVVDHVAHRVGPAWQQLDPTDPVAARAVAQVRLAAAEAKELLSSTTEAVVPVLLPGGPPRELRITRAEFEEMARGRLQGSVELLEGALAAADLTGDDLAGVLLLGGAARIPLIAQLVSGRVAAPVMLDPQPKFAVCLGALACRATTADVRVAEPPPGADATVRFVLPPMDDPSVVSPDSEPELPAAASAAGSATATTKPDRVAAPEDAAPPEQAATPDPVTVGDPPPATDAVRAPEPAPDDEPAPDAEPAPDVDRGTCTACGEANPRTTTYCRRCGAPLRDAPVTFTPGAGEPDADRPRRRRHPRRRGLGSRLRSLGRVGAVAGAGVGGVALLAIVVSQSGLLDREEATIVDPPLVTGPADPAPDEGQTAAPVRIDPTTITASASSSLAPIGDIRYEPDVVLDGDPTTAWNDGADGAIGIGERLTFQFRTPVELTSLEIVNGYDKIDRDSGEDRWEQNARVHGLGIVTDAGSTSVRLTDTREPQEVAPPIGRTCRVELTIESVHDGEDHLDVAISEVAFDGRPAEGTCPG